MLCCFTISILFLFKKLLKDTLLYFVVFTIKTLIIKLWTNMTGVRKGCEVNVVLLQTKPNKVVSAAFFLESRLTIN